MSETELPDDPSRWPTDPYRLLGVKRSTPLREVRRAYHKLIRRFKPEHTPEAFRKIREAFEAVEPYAPRPSTGPAEASDPTEPSGTDQAWQAESIVVRPDPVDFSTNGHAAPAEPIERPEPIKPAEPAEPIERPEPARPAEPTEPAEPIDRPEPARPAGPVDGWEMAIDGRFDDADRALRAEVDRGARSEDPYLRLYWLHALAAPGESEAGGAAGPVEADRPADWLVRGLKRSAGPSWRLWELLRREASIDPVAATGPTLAPLLAREVAPNLVLGASAWRWRGARRLGRWDLIAADVEGLRGWMPAEHPGPWAQALLEAAENLTWGRTRHARALRQAYRSEAERVARDEAIDVDALLLQIEYVDAVVNGLAKAGWRGATGRAFADLLRWCWDDRSDQNRPRVVDLARTLARKPRKALSRFDHLARKAPASLGFFWELLGRTEPSSPDAADAHAIDRFGARMSLTQYAEFRRHLLDFCLRERVGPQAVNQVFRRGTRRSIGSVVDFVGSVEVDHALQIAYRAVEVTWG